MLTSIRVSRLINVVVTPLYEKLRLFKTWKGNTGSIPVSATMDKQYKHLGAANGWIAKPQEVKECEEKKHKLSEEKLGNCYHEYTCDICNTKYTVDSSD